MCIFMTDKNDVILIGTFCEYRGHAGTIEYSTKENMHCGKILTTAESVVYEGKTLEDLYKNYKKSIDNYVTV